MFLSFIFGIIYGVLGFILLERTQEKNPEFFAKGDALLRIDRFKGKVIETIIDFLLIFVWPFYFIYAFCVNNFKKES